MKTLPIDQIIINDHNYCREMYNRYQKELDWHEKKKAAYEFIRALSQHSVAEEVVLYPAIENRFVNGKEIADQNRKEHMDLKHNLYKLDKMVPGEAGYSEQFSIVATILEAHAKAEEGTQIPHLRKSCYENELYSLGEQFMNIKAKAPTHPHPAAPDKPPLLTMVGMLQAPVDKLYDMISRDFPKTAAH